MFLWLIFATLTALAVVFTISPLIRPHTSGKTATSRDVYRDQLQEIEVQAAAGLIGPAEAEAAKAEVGRRLLAADAALAPTPLSTDSKQKRQSLALGITVGVTAIALCSYLWLGSPDLPGRPYAERSAERTAVEQQGEAELLAMLSQIEQRVASDPKDVTGRKMLARVYIRQGRIEDATKLYDEAIAALGNDADAPFLAEAATAHAFANEGQIDDAARALIAKAIAKDPNDTLTRHLRAEDKYQTGNIPGAIGDWESLLATMKADEPIRGMIEERLAEVKAKPQQATP